MSDEKDKVEDEDKPRRKRRAKAADAASDAAPKRRTRRRKPAAGEEEPKAAAASEKPKAAKAKAKAAEDKPSAADKPKPSAADKQPKPRARPARTRKAAEPEAAAKPTQAAGAPRRRRAPAEGAPPVVRAKARYVRTSPRKARLVCDHIRGKTVEEARAILSFTPRAVARDWSKLLESAVANAENNHELVGDDLRIREVHADAGPTIKRFRPRAMGRATPIRKRTSHLSIALTPKD